ncbi:hypothetical protein K2173_022670 [Erythroxylum novogranatense]|uniref:RING-type E3 ubiquitin transferase n=1 Tax=Erythroxylum novogranatense TaxID=1862640 RepID=A0AAV8TQM2_9ROSI|nr:hypothetical protein K2173_022670 [Erythroxylum novogranatense]
MGGCCCCSSKGAELTTEPSYYYYPRASEERVPLSSQHGTVAAISTGLLVDTNLDTIVPDAYTPPPAPIPFDVVLGTPQTPRGPQETYCNKNDGAVQTTNSGIDAETAGVGTQETGPEHKELKESDCKEETNLELNSVKELSKPVESLLLTTVDEDICPICLEEYDGENPKLTTNCEHHFHLACILEWMERSDSCPVCDKEMIINPPID